MIHITVAPAGPERFAARLSDGRELGVFRTPLFSSARALLAEGVPEESPIAMLHQGQTAASLTSTVGVAAGLAVKESASGGPRLGTYQPFDRSRLGSRDDD